MSSKVSIAGLAIPCETRGCKNDAVTTKSTPSCGAFVCADCRPLHQACEPTKCHAINFLKEKI